MVQIKLKTKTDVDFIMEIMSVFEKFEHQSKKYLLYLNTEQKGDEAVVYEKIIIPLFTDVLNYDKHKDFNPQATLSTGRVDNWIRNREGSPLIALEALRSNASQAEFIEHRQRLLSGYFDQLGAKYAILTNGVIFEVWHIMERARKIFIKVNFKEIYAKFVEKGVEAFVGEDWRKISNLITLKKGNQYLDVRKIYPEPQLDISEELHFNNFLSALQERMEEVKGDVLAKFEYLKGEYQECSEPIKQYKERTFTSIRRRYEKAQKFIESFGIWQKTSPTNTSPEAFCLETMYVFFNRILLIRICEDKGIIQRKISNGGIKKYIEYRGYIKFSQVDYKALLKEAYQIMDRFYPHLFQIDIFDWYEIDNDILLRVLFTFNPYNFNMVDRDVLGKLYEKYLDRKERKRLGEFYTPEEIIDYILDTVGYTPDSEIEGKKLLDPACGSGGFLVRATKILTEKLKNRGFDAETILRKLQESICGFDINPFACHLAETNLFFQVINLIHQAKENNPDFVMEKFNIYQTDSLRIPEKGGTLNLFPEGLTDYLIDANIVKSIKLKQGEFKDGFDFVVGNPPMVSNDTIPNEFKKYVELVWRNTAQHRYDLSFIFVELSHGLLKNGGSLGIILPAHLLTGEYFTPTRDFVFHSFKVDAIVDLKEVFFEEVANPICVVIAQKTEPIGNYEIWGGEITNKNELTNPKLFRINSSLIEYDFILNNRGKKKKTYRFLFSPLLQIFHSKNKNCKLLNEIGIITDGIQTANLLTTIFTKNPDDSSRYYKALRSGKEIPDRYGYAKWNGWYVLKPEYTISLKRPGFSYASPKRLECFSTVPKIILRQTEPTVVATLLTEQLYFPNSIFQVKLIDHAFNLQYILALINSQFLQRFYLEISRKSGTTKPQIYLNLLKTIPIKLLSEKKQQEFANLVDQILEINKNLPSLEAKVSNIQNLLKDFDFPFGDLADIPGIRIELRDRIGKPRIKREEGKVFLDSKSYVECESEYMANYIEFYLESLGDTLRGKTNSEVVDLVQIPKSPGQLKKVLQKRQELLKQIEELKHRGDEIDKEIDEKVYKLYGLTEEEIKIVKGGY